MTKLRDGRLVPSVFKSFETLLETGPAPLYDTADTAMLSRDL
jgi:hypothetical protein